MAEDEMSEERMDAVFLRLLAEMNFADRYYQYYEKCRGRGEMAEYTGLDLDDVLEEFPMKFKLHRKERFFGHTEKAGGIECIFNVAFPYSHVEFIVGFRTRVGTAGETYPGLAEQVKQLSDPDFEYDPPYPRIPFSNLGEMREAVAFGISLYEEMKAAVVNSKEFAEFV
jgi:hypothetical protein